jgi:hypothetical protein
MDEVEKTFKCNKGIDPSEIKWFATVNTTPQVVEEQYLDTLAYAPRKVDVLIRVDGTPGTLQGDLLERLAHHPKVGTIIIYGLPRSQRAPVAARAVMLGAHVRFCDSEDEVRVLLHKRRSRVISGNAPGMSAESGYRGVSSIH